MATSAERLKGILTVTVLKATDLLKSDWCSENDCYAVVSMEPLTFKAKSEHDYGKNQTEKCQRTQIRDGCHPIFDERLLFPIADKLEGLYVQLWDADYDKDDLLAYGNLNLQDDEQGGQYDTNLNKEWLHVVTIPMDNIKGEYGGTVELILHFIPETVAAYLSKRFDVAQAEVKKKITQQIVGKMTDVAVDKIRGHVGLPL